MFYKAPDNSLHFLSDEDIANGGEDLLPPGCVQITDAEHADLSKPLPLIGNALILSQIATLEASVTNRRMREAALGTDNGWLKGVDAQITALRDAMKTAA